MSPRFALYWAPPPDSALARFGAGWLGRDAESGALLPQPEIAGLAAERIAEITASPRRYGFHATLKAPFALTPDRDAAALREAVAALAANQAAFEIGGLALGSLSGFLAFTPRLPSLRLQAFALAGVQQLEPFRAPLPEAEIARRRAGGLTRRQDRQLLRFGYPYVGDDFRFHLTLTERLQQPERGRVLAILKSRAAAALATSVRIEEVCLFAQPEREAPFVIDGRYPLSGSDPLSWS